MVNFSQIQQLVSNTEDISIERLQSTTRKREVVFARQLIMYLMRKYTKESEAVIASRFGKAHCTCIHSVKTIKNLVETDRNIRGWVALYEIKLDSLLDFEKNMVIDKTTEIREQLKARIDNGFQISLESVIIYNKLIKGLLLPDTI
jgi:hypothetical protein